MRKQPATGARMQRAAMTSVSRSLYHLCRMLCEEFPNHHVIFLVDEIGQYIADDTQLMLNLQTIVEDLGTACKGKAWVIVTSEEDIDYLQRQREMTSLRFRDVLIRDFSFGIQC